MDNTFDWYAFSEGLGKISCDRILHLGNNKWEPSSVLNEGYNLPLDKERESITKEDEELRLCEIAWTEEKWIHDAITPYMEEANKASGWRYDIKYTEAMQITKYEKGGFYGWHRDGKGDNLSVYNMPENGYMHDKVRKLSMSVSLNEDFEGGDLEFSFYKEEKCNIETVKTNKLGNIVVFPSYQEHRISPVTKGTRYALVVWFIGPPFV